MTKSSSKKKLWRIFAEYIRLRDSPNGYGQCISCGKLVQYPNKTGVAHAGHYYPRSTTYSSLYFDERNVNLQCSHCNTYLEGNTEGYRRGLIAKYGSRVIDELDLKRSMKLKKIHSFQYDEMAKHYRKLVREMKKERGIT